MLPPENKPRITDFATLFFAPTAKAILLYILKKSKDKTLHRIFKILYFAEQKHLVKYGCFILSDTYIAKPKGPVPLKIYKLFRNIRKDNVNTDPSDLKIFKKAFEIKAYTITPKEAPDMDYIAASHKECILEAIKESHTLTFEQLTEKSRDTAWKKAPGNGAINPLNIAKAGGADKQTLKFIADFLETKQKQIVFQ